MERDGGEQPSPELERAEPDRLHALADYNEESLIFNSYIVSEEGFGVSVGFSPIFGGNYTLCFSGELRYDGCLTEDPDGDWVASEWSIIYRIHEV